MSTTLLYQAFGIRGYEYRRTDFFEGRVCFAVEQPRERYRCSECGSERRRILHSRDRGLLFKCTP
jgi:transposase